MIKDFDVVQDQAKFNAYQAKLLSAIQDILPQINIDSLAGESFIDITNNRITISLVHKEDKQTIITLNLFANYATLWYASCQIYFDEDVDLANFGRVYRNCLLAEYLSIEFYIGAKLIYSNTYMLSDKSVFCIAPNTIFYRPLILIFKKRLRTKEIKYKSFFK